MASKNVSAKNLVKIYKGQDGKQITAVSNVDFAIQAGDLVTLLGPSGCGKTTILRMIAGFETPTGGDIFIGDEKVTALTPDKRDTAMVFQSYALFPHLSVRGNVAYGLELRKLSKQLIDEKVSHILELVGLTGMDRRYPNQLSGGQQQRVALARALVMEPSVLLFDEPLSNLDAKLRIYMRSEIRKLQKKIGITSVYVTHDQAEAMSMSDKIIVMNSGAIEQVGTPEEIYNRPTTQFVADFIGAANIVDAKVENAADGLATVSLLGKTFDIQTDCPLPADGVVKVVVRPDRIGISRQGQIAGRVEASVFMGNSQEYKIRVGGHSLSVVAYNPCSGETFREEDEIFLSLKAADLHIVRA
jgi:iron(III) transport system ATP-binding protein